MNTEREGGGNANLGFCHTSSTQESTRSVEMRFGWERKVRPGKKYEVKSLRGHG